MIEKKLQNKKDGKNFLDKKLAAELINFIKKSPSQFHAIATIAAYLREHGFVFVPETQKWEIKKGGKYFTTRNDSSLIAFTVGAKLTDYHFQAMAAHSDSPTFKIKSVPELEGPGEYLRLNVEAYGGMIDSTWLDRPLGIAGRVMIKDGTNISTKLLHIERDVLLIPNVAIHMNRDANKGYAFNRQVDLCPLFSAGKLKKGDFAKMLAQELKVDAADIVASDLFLVNHQEAKVWGYADEFISAPKLDDLECAFAGMKAIAAADRANSVNVFCCFDNEEVGSNTKQGAMSTFFATVLSRLNSALGYDQEDYYRAVAASFMISADNAHAVHPNHKELTDDNNCVYMNKGIVIKEAANQKYTTDAVSRALFKMICNTAGVPVQFFANRSNMPGGSTLGNLSNIQVSMHAVDIGLAELAMHSSYETAGSSDINYLVQALSTLYNSNFKVSDDSLTKIQA